MVSDLGSRRPRAMVVLVLGSMLAVMQPTAPASAVGSGRTTLVSVESNGAQGDNHSSTPSISADGTVIAFQSNARNLVPGDTGRSDIFVRDLETGITTRVSVGRGGNQADRESFAPSISADGTRVAFESFARNLVPGDTNGTIDVFVRDLVAGATTLVSVNDDGTQGSGQAPSMNADGTVVAFESSASNLVPGDTNSRPDIFVRDLVAGSTTRVSVDRSGAQANGSSTAPSINAEGTVVAFESNASNMVRRNAPASFGDIYVHDLSAGSTKRVSIDDNRAQGNGPSTKPSISADGATVAFQSSASNLVPGDTNGLVDVFVRDLVDGATSRVSVDDSGAQGNLDTVAPSISDDGTVVAFSSGASNLVPGDTNDVFDIFLRDLVAGTTTRVSVKGSGNQSNGHSHAPSVGADGSEVAFFSDATNLVSGDGDTNGFLDVFVHELAGD